MEQCPVCQKEDIDTCGCWVTIEIKDLLELKFSESDMSVFDEMKLLAKKCSENRN